jgi:heme-degrading monooxygenase HmoA
MYVILWEYQVRAENMAKFEEIYGADGAWARLFQRSDGFIRTDLLRHERHKDRFLTMDWWQSLADYEAFLSQWGSEYTALDRQCEGLAEYEALLGKWQAVLSGAR